MAYKKDYRKEIAGLYTYTRSLIHDVGVGKCTPNVALDCILDMLASALRLPEVSNVEMYGYKLEKEYEGFHKIEKVKTKIKGRSVDRELLHLPNAVAAVIVDKNGRFAMVRQYRFAVGRYTDEIPAGVLDKEGLTPEQVLIEEIEEECELDRNLLTVEKEIAFFNMVTGSSPANTVIYLVRYDGIGKNNYHIKDNDVEALNWFREKSIRNMLANGRFADAKTNIGLLNYFLNE